MITRSDRCRSALAEAALADEAAAALAATDQDVSIGGAGWPRRRSGSLVIYERYGRACTVAWEAGAE